jgi:hypothetical protein
MRTARSRTSGENLIDFCFSIAPFSQEVEPPEIPARFSATPDDALLKLANDNDMEVLAGVVSNHKTPSQITLKVIEEHKDNSSIMTTAAGAKGLDERIYWRLSQDDMDYSTHALLAGNPSVSIRVGEKLMGYTDGSQVLSSLAYNPATTPEMLARLANLRATNTAHPEYVWNAVATNRNTPVATLRELAGHELYDVRDRAFKTLRQIGTT